MYVISLRFICRSVLRGTKSILTLRRISSCHELPMHGVALGTGGWLGSGEGAGCEAMNSSLVQLGRGEFPKPFPSILTRPTPLYRCRYRTSIFVIVGWLGLTGVCFSLKGSATAIGMRASRSVVSYTATITS